jgi:sec-independent protein translocase protein TatA
MNVFGVGPTEIFVILIVILVLFGPDKLPEIAKKIGGASREIRENLNTINEQMNSALEQSMELEKLQMLKPPEPPVVDSTAQTPAPPTADTDGHAEPSETILPPAKDADATVVPPETNDETPPSTA